MAPKIAIEHGSGEFTCDCGRTFTHAAWYTKHKMRCDGVPIATEGRIAARDKALAVLPAKRRGRIAVRITAKDKVTPALRRISRAIDRATTRRTPPAAKEIVEIRAAATDKAMEIVIAGLIAKRDVINHAIAALQAVS